MPKKPFGGVIENWHKQQVAGEAYGLGILTQKSLDEKYGENLGFIVKGYLKEDPTWRFGRGPLRTSLVVKFIKTPSKTHKGFDYSIETLNTIYHLGKPLGNGPKLGEFY